MASGFAKYQDPDLVGNFIDTDNTVRFIFRLESDGLLSYPFL